MEPVKSKLLNGSDKAVAIRDFVDSLGGENAMRQLFPRTYEAYQQTNNHPNILSKAVGNTSVLYDDEQNNCFLNIEHVAYVDKTKKQLYIQLVSEFEDNKNFSSQQIKVSNHKTGELLKTDINASFLGSRVKNGFIVDLNGCNVNDLRVTVNSCGISNEMSTFKREESLTGFNLEGETTYQVDAPKITHKNEKNKDISVSFYSSKEFGFAYNDWDYWYPQCWKDQLFRLANKGKFVANGLHLVSISSCYLTVINANGVSRQHTHAISGVKLEYDAKENRSTICWDIDENWGFPFTDLMGLHGDFYNSYELSINAITNNGKIKTFYLTNRELNKAGSVATLPKLRIYTDCFVKGTLITLADGSQKPVEKLHIGDRTLSPNRQNESIRFVDSTKTKTALVQVKLENGDELIATKGHLIATSAGMRCMSLLSAGDRVETQDGSHSPVRSVTEMAEKECEIVIVGLPGNRLFANRMLVGDSEAELTEQERADNIRLQVPKEWRKDYDSWMTKI